MLPYNARLWGVPAHEITSEWCERFVPLPSLEDVAAGAVGFERPPLGYNAEFYYPRLGIGELAQALARRVGNLELGQQPLGIDSRQRHIEFADKRITYDVLINTAPLPVLLGLLGSLPDNIKRARDALRCSRLWYLDVGLSRPSGVDAHWIYVPEEKYPFYRVGAYSRFSPDLAPEGCGSLYVELVSRDRPDLGQLMPLVSEALRTMRLIESESQIEFARPRLIDFAYVIYDKDYSVCLGKIKPYLEAARILSVGRYGGWNYSAMEDALRFGEQAAQCAWELLK
jgi:protoporphyrinogen oxidase